MTDLHPTLQEYYEEIDPGKRCTLLTAYLEETGGARDASDIYRVDLFNARFPDQSEKSPFGFFKRQKRADIKKDSRNDPAVPNTPGETDLFLKEILYFLTMCKNTGLFSGSHKKEVQSALRRMQLDDRPEKDKACEEVLYLELRNTVRRYFSTCYHSSYGAKLFGLPLSGLSGDADKERYRCIDTWNFSFGTANLWELTEDTAMALLCRAANDEYCASCPDVPSLESAYRIYEKPKKML